VNHTTELNFQIQGIMQNTPMAVCAYVCGCVCVCVFMCMHACACVYLRYKRLNKIRLQQGFFLDLILMSKALKELSVISTGQCSAHTTELI
jgi:hypothetical protein